MFQMGASVLLDKVLLTRVIIVLQMSSSQIRVVYIMLPEDRQVKKMLAKQIHSRQEKRQLNFQVCILTTVPGINHFLLVKV